MASKVTGVMKRPAGRALKKNVVIADSSKKRKIGLDIVGECPSSALSILEEQLPKNTFEIVAAVVGQRQQLDTSVELQKHEEVAMQMASNVFTSMEDMLLSDAKLAQAKLAGVEAGWAERSWTLEAAQAELLKIRNDIVEAKSGIKMASKAVESARQEVKKMKVAEKSCAGTEKVISARIGSLEAAEKDVFQPLKEASVNSLAGKKKLKHLQKVGKQFGFHDVLLNTTMPKVVLKHLDKRQTFDNFAIEQMEAEFAKKHAELENTLRGQKFLKLDREAALQMAQRNVVDSQHQRDANASKLLKAERALAAGKQAVVAARRELRKFDTDSQKIVRESTQAEAQLRSFLDGPLATFKQLEISLMPPSPNLRPPTFEATSAEAQTALKSALTRIGTMAIPASPTATDEEDEDKIEEPENEGEQNAEEQNLDELDKQDPKEDEMTLTMTDADY